MLFTCAHVYTRTTHAHACALYLDIRAKPKTFLRAHTRVLQGIYIRGRTYAHARAQISKNIYCIHYYDSFHNMHILSYTSIVYISFLLFYLNNINAFLLEILVIFLVLFIVFGLQVISVYM